MNNIGEIIKKKRVAMDLSRDKLARKTGITPKSIISVENGSLPSTRTLLKLLDALDLEMKIVDKKEKRTLTDDELEFITDTVVQDIFDGSHRSFITIDKDLDVELQYLPLIKRHYEDEYDSGTGAWIIDECSVTIISLDAFYADVAEIEVTLPDTAVLAELIEEKIMEG